MEGVTKDWAPAMFENYVHSLARIAELGPDAASERVGPWLCIDAGVGESPFNVAVLRESPRDLTLALRQAEDWYAARGINIRLDLRVDDDAKMLAAAAMAGYRTWWVEPALLLEPLPASWPVVAGLDASTVSTPAEVAAYAGLDAEEYSDTAFQEGMARTAIELSGCDLLVGWLAGKPAARSMAVTTGELVGVHNVYVPPSLRGRGLGAAITAVAIDAGRRRGATAACLEATPLGRPVYERMGFKKVTDYVVMGQDLPA